MNELLDRLREDQVSQSDLYDLSALDPAEAVFFQEAWPDLSVDVRRRVIRMLAEISENDLEVNFSQVFRMALHDSDGQVRTAAVEGLWEDEDVRLIPDLVARLADSEEAVRAAAAMSLGRFLLLGELQKIRPPAHEETFRALLATFDSAEEVTEVRRRALESLAYSGEECVVDLIQEAYAGSDDRLRLSAVFAMGRSGDERWASHVLQELHSPDPAMRYEAVLACGELALREGLEDAIAFLDDVDSEVQEAAAWALGQIGGDEARQALLNCAASGDEALCRAAREALREFEFLHGDLGAFLLFDMFEEDEEEEGDEFE